MAPAAELSVCARNSEAFSSAAFQLYAAKDPLHFHASALVQKEKGSSSVCLRKTALQLELASSCAHGLGVSGAGCSRPIIICQSVAAGTINFPRCEIPEMAYPLSLDDPRAPLRTLTAVKMFHENETISCAHTIIEKRKLFACDVGR